MEGVETNQVKPKVFKIIVIGDSGVGKTSITYRFCSSAFPKTCEATIGVDFRERTLCIDNELIKVSFFFPLYCQLSLAITIPELNGLICVCIKIFGKNWNEPVLSLV